MGLVIDTNVFIDAENGRFDLTALNDYTEYGEAFISAITVSELLTGVHMAKNTAIRIKRSAFVDAVLSGVPALDFTEEVARTYAELYAHFLKKRTKPSSTVHDLQIAATAITYGYAVLTSNVNDFKKVPGLIVECPK
jgi:predicted nucleic acid-binding protein